MAGINGMGSSNAMNAYAAQKEFGTKSAETNKTTNSSKASDAKAAAKKMAAGILSKDSTYGNVLGEPKLSETGQKYYDELKKKYGDYDFILVSKDEKANAKANAAKYANGFKTVVLIGEDEVEKMATDENFRKKYEGILDGAKKQLEQLKAGMGSAGANVKGYGMQVNDNGTLSFFAVLKKSSADQKHRIEEKAAQKKADKKEADKKAARKESEERIKKSGHKDDKKIKDSDEEDLETISADSIEELMSKIADFTFADRSNVVQTDAEKMIGQSIDFKG